MFPKTKSSRLSKYLGRESFGAKMSWLIAVSIHCFWKQICVLPLNNNRGYFSINRGIIGLLLSLFFMHIRVPLSCHLWIFPLHLSVGPYTYVPQLGLSRQTPNSGRIQKCSWSRFSLSAEVGPVDSTEWFFRASYWLLASWWSLLFAWSPCIYPAHCGGGSFGFICKEKLINGCLVLLAWIRPLLLHIYEGVYYSWCFAPWSWMSIFCFRIGVTKQSER